YSLRSYFLTNRWGSQHWCAREAFYLFGHEIGVRYEPETIALLLEWARLSKSVGWWAPWDGICFVSDRPREVHFDGERRLHCEAGPAVRYSDGWGCHAWHGTRVPAPWIEDKGSVSPADILRHKNMEQRRAGTEIFGWAKILQSLGARTVNEDSDPEIGALIEVDLPDVGPSRFVRVRCGTGREFAIGVPPDITSALDGHAWIAGIQTEDFIKPEVRS
ncbi:DUF6745 domain-containing protein, partial [Xanthobacter autotrophicus]|uniref:DUF6745 domain-containing protein n=1 Tax=Xanthobacter autotrophicus TaxID=280 RepID=UPI0037263A16